jgi:signal recognition particle receptor subunit beta
VLKSVTGSIPTPDQMVFFNYATMQMAAKIVYYGPGLCGKTTNLHHIYGRTAPDSRGEMVSLETETDRTLFFDLLPLDVGVISGFKTRVQLYTVPGQVFYNTTRKLVLKGVDGIVFVADSQRAMKDANLESFANLKTNLAEIGVTLDELPLALQYNKRDLANILTVDELDQALNGDKTHESYEASAIHGQGVFETLKAISRLTLRSLKKRMTADDRPSRSAAPARSPAPTPGERPLTASAEEKPAARAPFEQQPGPRPTIALSSPFVGRGRASRPDEYVPTEIEFEPESARSETELADVSFAQSAQPEASAEAVVKHVRVGSNVDILAELERLRKNATSLSPAGRPSRRASSGISVDDLLANSLNHRKEVSRVFDVEVPRRDLASGQHVAVTLQFKDRNNQEVGEEKAFSIPLESAQDLEKLVLALKFQILGK